MKDLVDACTLSGQAGVNFKRCRRPLRGKRWRHRNLSGRALLCRGLAEYGFLFGAAWSACYMGALELAANKRRVKLPPDSPNSFRKRFGPGFGRCADCV